MEETPLSTEVLDDGCIRVCLGDGTNTVCTTVSSFHLVECKRTQLEFALLDMNKND